MKKKKPSSSPAKIALLVALACVVTLALFTSTVGRRDFNLPHKLFLEGIGFLQSGTAKATGLSKGIWHHYIRLTGVSRENDQLKEEIRKLKAQNVQYREAMATNFRLSKLLELKQSSDIPVLTATIIGRDPAIWFRTLIVDQGSSAGVEKGMPVVTVEGVVGQIVNTSPNYAKVLLAIDPNSAIDAVVQSSRAQGIAKGTGELYQLHYVLKNIEVAQDDLVVTSGMSGSFPKGLLLGRVVNVAEKNKRGMFQSIDVEPAVNFRQLEHVTIILTEDSLVD